MRPRYKHSCSSNDCAFMGYMSKWDVYRCKAQFRDRLVLRYLGTNNVNKQVVEVSMKMQGDTWQTTAVRVLNGNRLLSHSHCKGLATSAIKMFMTDDHQKFEGALERLKA